MLYFIPLPILDNILLCFAFNHNGMGIKGLSLHIRKANGTRRSWQNGSTSGSPFLAWFSTRSKSAKFEEKCERCWSKIIFWKLVSSTLWFSKPFFLWFRWFLKCKLRAFNRFAPILMQPVVRALVAIWFIIYCLIAVYGCTQIKEGLEPVNLLVEDSYAIPHYRILEKYFWHYGAPLQVIWLIFGWLCVNTFQKSWCRLSECVIIALHVFRLLLVIHPIFAILKNGQA